MDLEDLSNLFHSEFKDYPIRLLIIQKYTMTKVVWFGTYVEEMDRAQNFYETVLDLELSDMADPTESDDQSMIMGSFPGDMDTFGSGRALVKMTGFEAGKKTAQRLFGIDKNDRGKREVIPIQISSYFCNETIELQLF